MTMILTHYYTYEVDYSYNFDLTTGFMNLGYIFFCLSDKQRRVMTHVVPRDIVCYSCNEKMDWQLTNEEVWKRAKVWVMKYLLNINSIKTQSCKGKSITLECHQINLA